MKTKVVIAVARGYFVHNEAIDMLNVYFLVPISGCRTNKSLLVPVASHLKIIKVSAVGKNCIVFYFVIRRFY